MKLHIGLGMGGYMVVAWSSFIGSCKELKCFNDIVSTVV